MKTVVKKDIESIYNSLSGREISELNGKTILVTGGAGFIGRYLLSFLCSKKDELGIKRVICLDNFAIGEPKWLKELVDDYNLELHQFNIITDDIAGIPRAEEVDYIFHMASIASPVFYRRYPIETLDANVWGLRSLLEYYKDKNLKKLAFFSSSEIYGDPDAEHIPTDENYRGNVDCKGPRSCYDEAKRFGETLCYLFNQQYKIPVVIIRPFNNYGPGMKLNDARVSADFFNAIRENRDIDILSDGKPTRTFCYISDTVTGYLKCLLNESDFETFNIGSDGPEISILEFAESCAKLGRDMLGYTGSIRYQTSDDAEYMTNNPRRRCPNIDKARKQIGYNPSVDLEQGIRNMFNFIRENKEEELTW